MRKKLLAKFCDLLHSDFMSTMFACTELNCVFLRSHLLRAIDVRLMTLHQELKVALARATTAGFSGGHMANLMAFSERFGPNRLR
jgi:hypothetical protein